MGCCCCSKLSIYSCMADGEPQWVRLRASALYKETSFVLCPKYPIEGDEKAEECAIVVVRVALLLNKYSYLKDTMSLLEQYREMCVVAVVVFISRLVVFWCFLCQCIPLCWPYGWLLYIRIRLQKNNKWPRLHPTNTRAHMASDQNRNLMLLQK